MKRFSVILVLGFGSLGLGATLDVDGVGRDLNGWQGDHARYGIADALFEAGKPTLSHDGEGNLIIEAELTEKRNGTSVYQARIRMMASPDGQMQTVSISGTVDGKTFETGEGTRPEPIPVGPSSEENVEASSTPAEVAEPLDPEEQMRKDLGQRLSGALERARASKEVVKRDLSARIFASAASETDVLAEGTAVWVRSLFKRTS